MLKFPRPIDAGSVSWSPTMSLLLTVENDGKSVTVHRSREGHKVWEIDELPDKARCCDVIWASDGKRVGLLTTKSNCLVYDINSGRLLLSVNVKVDTSIGKWVNLDNDTNSKFDLNDDILRSLPKLLPLPASFNGIHKFSSRQHIDSMIQNNSDDGIDLLLLFGNNYINVTINSLFSIGSVDIFDDNDGEATVDYLSINENHFILTSSMMTGKFSIKNFKIDFNSPYLNKTGSIISKLIALLGYTDEVLVFLSQETRNYLDFNNKYLNILKDELNKRNESVSDELYNLLLTGMMNDDVKDWLENSIGDRGIKKWEKLGEITFENVKRTILYHLIPSNERLIILLNELNSIYEILLIEDESKEILNLIKEMINSVKDYLNLIFQYIIKINREQELFNSFINWINFVLLELQEEANTKFQYKTSEVSKFIIDNHLEKSILFMLIPNFRRNFNKIKINSSDLFNNLKLNFQNNIEKGELNISLGFITESFKLIFNNNNLILLAKLDASLKIYKIDATFELAEFEIQFNNRIDDFKSNNDELYVLCNNELKIIKISNLIEINENINESKISKSIGINEPGLNFKNLSINFNKKISCLISSDFQTYKIFDL